MTRKLYPSNNRGPLGRRRKHLQGRLKHGKNYVAHEPEPKTEDEIRNETAEVIARIMGK